MTKKMRSGGGESYKLHPKSWTKWYNKEKGALKVCSESKRKVYSGEFKQEVVEALRREYLSCNEAAGRFGIGGHTRVRKWERIYLKESKKVHMWKGIAHFVQLGSKSRKLMTQCHSLLLLAELPRSTYYYRAKKPKKSARYEQVKKEILRIFNKNKGRHGYRRITAELQNNEIEINYNQEK